MDKVTVVCLVTLFCTVVVGQELPVARAAGSVGGGIDEESLKKFLPLIVQNLPFLNLDFSKANVSAECNAAMQIWIKSLSKLSSETMWALQMADASGKIPSGFLRGGFPIFGSFDECLDIVAGPEAWANISGVPEHRSPILGQYCGIKLKELKTASKKDPEPDPKTDPKPKPVVGRAAGNADLGGLKAATTALLRLDVCLPHACSEKDINGAFEYYLRTLKLSFKPVAQQCQVKKKTTLEGCQIAAIVVLSILGFLLLAGTLLDVGLLTWDHFADDQARDSLNKRRWVQALLAFSMYSNCLKVLDTRQSPDSLTAVHGIRFLSMTWVILGHSYGFLNVGILGNVMIITDMLHSFPMQAILNGYLSVDSFFFLSGLLLAYVTIKELRKSGRLNAQFFAMFYFHRFWRLTPAVILTILSIFLWPLMLSGPLFVQYTDVQYSNCKKNWWVNLLYLQNLVNKEEMCMGHSWYLANDMQFYVVSPLILVSLYINRYLGLVVNGLFLLTTLLTTGILTHVNHFMPAIIIADNDEEANLKYMGEVYIKPWCRIGPFCIGIFVGYFLAFKRNYKIPRVVKLVCWCVAIICNVSVLYATHPWNSGTPPTRFVADLYGSVHRTIWAVGLGWLTFACATGNGGIVNRILSWKPLVPLSRMTYLAYLIHPFIQYTFGVVLRERIVYTHYLYVALFLGFLVISYGLAFPLSLAFEAPFLALEKIILPRTNPKKTSVALKTSPVDPSVEIENPSYGKDNTSYVDTEQRFQGNSNTPA